MPLSPNGAGHAAVEHTPRTALARARFVRGLVGPSLPALLLTLLVAAAWLAAAALFVTPERVASRFGDFLIESRADRDARLTRQVLGLAMEERLEEPTVVLVGASDFREAILSPSTVARALGTRVEFLSTDWQSLLDSAAIVEQLPRFDGALVLMVNPILLARGATYEPTAPDQPPFHRRYGFRSDVRDEIARAAGVDVPERTGNLFLDNREFYLARAFAAARNLVAGPPEAGWHIWKMGREPFEEEKRVEVAERLATTLEGYRRNADASLELLQRICATARGRGDVDVVLLEAPMSPRGLRDIVGLERYAEHCARLRSFAAAHDVAYWNFDGALERSDADYIDDQHLVSAAARTRFTDLLVERVRALRRPIGEAP